MKLGKIEQSVLVSILLAIVIGGVILVVIVFPVSGTGGGLSDGLCHFNMALRNALPSVGLKSVAGTSLCQEIKVGTINADADSKCPKSYDNDETKCGAYQLAVLADRCWYRGGGRNSNLGELDTDWEICFKEIKVYNLGDQLISENDIKNVISENKFAHNLKSNDITFEFADAEGVISKGESVRIEFITPQKPQGDNYVCIGTCIFL